VGGGVVAEFPPPQLIVNIAAKMQRLMLNSNLCLSLRGAWLPTKMKPKTSIPAAASHPDRLSEFGGTSPEVCAAAAVMVSVAVACPLTVTVDGLRLQVM